MGSIVTDSNVVLTYLGIDSSDDAAVHVASSITNAEGAIKRYLRYDPVYSTRDELYPRHDFLQASGSGYWDVTSSIAFYSMSGGVGDKLQLQGIPVRSITNLWLNYDARNGTRGFTSEDLRTEGDDFWPNYDLYDSDGNPVCWDGVLNSHGLWPGTPGCVRVQYVAGFTAAEFTGSGGAVDASPIYEAVISEASRRVRQAVLDGSSGGSGTGSTFTGGTVTKERLGDYSYEIGSTTSGTSTERVYGAVNTLTNQTKDTLHDFVNWAIFD